MLLHNRFTANDNDIWAVAVKRGYNTYRTNPLQVKEHIEGYDFIRYYGNTLHKQQIEHLIPIKFHEVDYSILSKLNHYTKRNIQYIDYKDLAQPIERKCFIKPARDKWFECRVFEKGETIFGSPLPNDKIYVSDVVNFTDEVRCFVLNGEVLTSSLYRINKVAYDIADLDFEKINFDLKINDTPIPRYVKEICGKFNINYGIVMDFGLLDNGEWAFIEFNEAWASGLYCCDYEKCFDVIVSSQYE